jgi:hypothetical protein
MNSLVAPYVISPLEAYRGSGAHLRRLIKCKQHVVFPLKLYNFNKSVATVQSVPTIPFQNVIKIDTGSNTFGKHPYSDTVVLYVLA